MLVSTGALLSSGASGVHTMCPLAITPSIASDLSFSLKWLRIRPARHWCGLWETKMPLHDRQIPLSTMMTAYTMATGYRGTDGCW